MSSRSYANIPEIKFFDYFLEINGYKFCIFRGNTVSKKLLEEKMCSMSSPYVYITMGLIIMIELICAN